MAEQVTPSTPAGKPLPKDTVERMAKEVPMPKYAGQTLNVPLDRFHPAAVQRAAVLDQRATVRDADRAETSKIRERAVSWHLHHTPGTHLQDVDQAKYAEGYERVFGTERVPVSEDPNWEKVSPGVYRRKKG